MAKYLSILILSLSFFGSSVFSQSLFESTLSSDRRLFIRDALPLQDGSVILAGYAYPLVGVDSSMAILLKLDSTYKVLWSKRYKALFNDEFVSLTLLLDGNILLGGRQRNPGFSNQAGASITKIDTAGTVLWSKVYAPSSDNRLLKVYEEADGTLRLFIYRNVTDSPFQFVHADSAGNMLSQSLYFRGSRGVQMRLVTKGENENYFLAGQIFEPVTSHYDLRICSYNSSGLQWYRQFDFGQSITPTGIAYNNGRIAVSGYSIDTANSLTYNSWICIYDTVGNPVGAWEISQTIPDYEFLNSIQPVAGGGFLALGNISMDTITKILMVRIDQNGNAVNLSKHGYFDAVGAGGAVPLADGGAFIYGTTVDSLYFLNTDSLFQTACSDSSANLLFSALGIIDSSYSITPSSPSFTVNTNSHTITAFPARSSLVCGGIVVVPGLEKTFGMDLYPVPADNELNVGIPPQIGPGASLSVFNSQGKLVEKFFLENENNLRLDIQQFPKGIYLIRINTADRDLTQRFVKK